MQGVSLALATGSWRFRRYRLTIRFSIGVDLVLFNTWQTSLVTLGGSIAQLLVDGLS